MSLKATTLIATLSVALAGCVSQEQMERNKARHERISQGKSFALSGCQTVDGKNSCFETAKQQCAALGQQFSWMYQTNGQARAGDGEMTVECIPPAKDT